jgi:hypothetical protein
MGPRKAPGYDLILGRINEINGILKIKNGDYEACLKYSVRIFVE